MMGTSLWCLWSTEIRSECSGLDAAYCASLALPCAALCRVAARGGHPLRFECRGFRISALLGLRLLLCANGVTLGLGS
jgi:hypothetical protein